MFAKYLFQVTDTFFIKGRGLILIPGISPKGDERFRVGDFVELRKPDASSVRVMIAGIEMFTPRPADGSFPIMLKEPNRKEDVPIGTEVWSIADESSARPV